MQVWQKRGNATTILEAILARAEASEEELLAPCPVPPEAIDGIPAAADLIVRCALQGDMPVVIVGDYDADGVTATAILVKLLHHFGVSPRAIIPTPSSSPWTTALPLWSPSRLPRRRGMWC